VTYAGDLVALRAREPEDAEHLQRWNSDPETMLWWDAIYPAMPVEGYAARVASQPPLSFGFVSFVVTDRTDGTPIGWGGLFGTAPVHRHAELGVMIGEAAYRGRGYGTDATRTLCRFAFDRMHLVRVSLTVFPGNTAGRRAYEGVGFVEEGVQRRAAWKRGAWHDLAHMAVFPETLR
jgi:RimJ/RimL family protein N-acetyltransferase